MKPVDFTLHRPETLADAVEILAAHPDDSKVLAGGQSLVPLLNFRLARPEHLVDLSRIAGLAQLRRTALTVSVGAMVRQVNAERSPAVAADVPLLAAALPHVAHPPIRVRGTVGGSLAHGDPAAELPAVARALDATFVAVGPSGRREIAARDFFLANLMTALASDEVLVEVLFDHAPANTGAAFDEVGRRRGDFALVGAGAQVTVEGDTMTKVRIALTGVSATPHRATEAERFLAGKEITESTARDAAHAAMRDAQPMTRNGYKVPLFHTLIRRTILAAANGSQQQQGGAQ
jgi:CO/xanthine dehydrogenase FAD-binding subunit